MRINVLFIGIVTLLITTCLNLSFSQVFLYENFETGTNDDCECPANFNCLNDAGRAVIGFHQNYAPSSLTCSLSGAAYTTSQGAHSGDGAIFYYAGGDRLVSDPIEVLSPGFITFSVWYAGPKGNEIPPQQFGDKAFFTFGLDNQRVGPEIFPEDKDWSEVCFGMEVNAGFHTFEIFTGDAAQYAFWFDDFQVSRIEQLELLGNDTIVCEGDSVILTIPGNVGNFEWNDGSNDTFLLVTETGEYTLSIGVGCEQYVNSINIDFIAIENANLPTDTFLCDGEEVILELVVPGDVIVEWQDGSNETSYTISEEGLYILELTNGCGTSRDSFYTVVSEDFDFSLGQDSILCFGEELILGISAIENLNYTWNDGSDSSFLIVDSTGDYSVTVSNGCFEHVDAIYVEFFLESDFDFGQDTQICQGDILIFLCPPGASCTWSDASQVSSFEVSDTGLYFVEINDPCKSYFDTLLVSFGEDLSVFLDSVVLCEGDSFFVFQISTEFEIEWLDTPQDFIVPLNSACYEYQIEGSCSQSVGCVYIQVESIIDIDLGEDELLCEGEFKILEAADLINYLWSTGEVNESINISESGVYWLSSFNSCFMDTDTLRLDFEICKNCDVYIPNIFSPNDDFDNDIFQVYSQCAVESSELIILNRWGEQVFASQNILQGWDGRFKGDRANTGVYVYQFKYRLNGENLMKTGDVTLIY